MKRKPAILRLVLWSAAILASGFPARQGNGIDSERIVVEESGLEWGR